MNVDVVANGGFKVARAAKDATPQLLRGQESKPTLDIAGHNLAFMEICTALLRACVKPSETETGKHLYTTGFDDMVKFLRRSSSVRVLLVEKTDRLYRNLKDYVTMDELDLEIHFVKESVVLSKDSRSSEKFMHGIKVLMAKNYIDNLSEETKKGMLEKAEQAIYPSFAPLGYRNVMGPNGKRIIEPDPDVAPIIIQIFQWYATGQCSIADITGRVRQAGLVSRAARKPISKSNINKVLRKRIYTVTSIGMARHTGAVISR